MTFGQGSEWSGRGPCSCFWVWRCELVLQHGEVHSLIPGEAAEVKDWRVAYPWATDEILLGVPDGCGLVMSYGQPG